MSQLRWSLQGDGKPGLVQPGADTALGAPNSSTQCLWRGPWGDGDGIFTVVQGARMRNKKEKLNQKSFSLIISRNFFPMRTVRQMCKFNSLEVFTGWCLMQPDLTSELSLLWAGSSSRDFLRSLPVWAILWSCDFLLRQSILSSSSSETEHWPV